MKRTTGMLVLLAVLGGCTSFRPGADFGDRAYNDGRRQAIPGPAPVAWKENERQVRGYPSDSRASNPAGAAPVGYRPEAGALAQASARTPAGNGNNPSGITQASYRPEYERPPAYLIDPPPAPVKPPAQMPSVGDFSAGSNAPAALAAVTPAPRTSPRPTNLPDLDRVPELGLPPARIDSALAPAPSEPVCSSSHKTDLDSPPAPVSIPPAATSVPPARKEPGTGPLVLEHQAGRTDSPAVRMVNSKHITINYELKEVGPSGVSSVELWYTQDGKVWKKRDVSNQTKPPYTIEVNEEGLYGFTLLARNGIGLSSEPPQSGDLPQIWVEVDMTSPVVHLTGVNANCSGKMQNVIIRWSASDKNLGPRPITLSYAAKEEGPWKPIAANVANSGRFVWPLPSEVPARFLIRVEAADIVGNVGMAQTPKPVLMDRARPVVSITSVEPGR